MSWRAFIGAVLIIIGLVVLVSPKIKFLVICRATSELRKKNSVSIFPLQRA